MDNLVNQEVKTEVKPEVVSEESTVTNLLKRGQDYYNQLTDRTRMLLVVGLVLLAGWFLFLRNGSKKTEISIGNLARL